MLLCGWSRACHVCAKVKLFPAGCKYLTTESANEWSKWEFGNFDDRKSKLRKLEPINAPPKRFDYMWSKLTTEQVEVGIAALKIYTSEERITRMQSVLDKRTVNIRFVFENPSNMNNIWAALRTFDSFGLQYIDIISDGSSVLKYKSNKMTESLGTQKWLTLTQYTSTDECLSSLKSQGYRIVATDLHTDSKKMQDIDWCGSKSKKNTSTDVTTISTNADATTCNNSNSNSCNTHKIAIVVGNENKGISSETRSKADELFYIPMKGFAESFNLSVACAVICSHLESTGALNTPLDDDTKRRLLLTWLARSVEAAVPILRREGVLQKDDDISNHLYEQICGFSTKP